MKLMHVSLKISLLLLAAFAPATQAAEAYPSKPVRMIVPFGPASGLDPVARALAERLTAQTGVSFVVENREGASGLIGVSAGAAAAPDGQTITMVVHPPFAAAPYLQRKMAYDPVKDFTPIARVSTTPLILITAMNQPFQTFTEMIAYARQNPGKLNYANTGIGTASHLYMEQMILGLGLKMVSVPYKSTGQLMTDTISGQVNLSLPSLVGAAAQVTGGRVRLLGVGSSTRAPNFPNAPTFAEATGLPNFEAVVYYGFVGPRGMPEAMATKISREMGIALQTPQLVGVLQKGGATSAHTSPAEFAAIIQRSAGDAQRIIRELNIQPQD